MKRLGRRSPMLVAAAARVPSHKRFQRVLVDAPCSGTGTLRKHPELKWRVSQEEIERLGCQILEWLESLAGLVAPGGLLVFMTCSLEAEENESLMARFQERHVEFGPYDLGESVERPLKAGVTGPGTWRVLPADDHDGFSVQVLSRSR